MRNIKVNVNKYKVLEYNERRDLYLLMLRLQSNNGAATKEDIIRMVDIYSKAYPSVCDNGYEENLDIIYNTLIELNNIYDSEKVNKPEKKKGLYRDENGNFKDSIPCKKCYEIKPKDNFLIYANRNGCKGFSILRVCKSCRYKKSG